MIQIEGLVKKFGNRTAIDHLNLEIRPGEIFGLLGPNGAGKTTLIRILTMLARPTAGSIAINGWRRPADERKIKAILGIVPQHINLDPDLLVGENLDLHGRLHHVSAKERKRRTRELLDYVGLKERCNDMVPTLSGGMKRRLMIARALLHHPRILFLDEPTVGLDPQVRRRLWDLIRRMNNDQITVLLTTHYIEEAENLCGRVAILDQGRLIALDSPEGLCRRVGRYVVEWDTDDGRKTNFFPDREKAAEFAGGREMTTTIRASNLEDVFVELTGRKVNESC
jgi:ABC-2 type transport system ATP-binding protein